MQQVLVTHDPFPENPGAATLNLYNCAYDNLKASQYQAKWFMLMNALPETNTSQPLFSDRIVDSNHKLSGANLLLGTQGG